MPSIWAHKWGLQGEPSLQPCSAVVARPAQSLLRKHKDPGVEGSLGLLAVCLEGADQPLISSSVKWSSSPPTEQGCSFFEGLDSFSPHWGLTP